MTGTSVDRIIGSREVFLARTIERLGGHPSDFQTVFRDITTAGGTSRRRAAGVLLPLLFRGSSRENSNTEGSFLFQLIKRSPHVPQPGDLSFPGGMLHPVLDRLLRPLLIHGPFPILAGDARKYAISKNRVSYRLISLFLTTALRESWEEIRLPPSRVTFLGPLPTYGLTLFRRTIFPVAGFVENQGALQPNREVEKIIEIPLSAFFQKENFGCYQMVGGETGPKGPLQYPCLIHHDPDGGREILWGATFNIIVAFLGIVLDYRLPAWERGPVIQRSLNADYLTGRRFC